MRLARWSITALTAIVLATIIVASTATWGGTEEAVRVVVRATARVSVTLFLLAFSAASVRALFPSRGSTWLLQNRRYFGVSFALSHFTHLAALFALAAWFPHPFVDDLNAVTLIGGGLAYLFIAAMTVTSFAPPRRAIGERAWKILHTTGSYYIWLIFVQSYLPRAVQDPTYAPFALALLMAFGLRMAHWFKRRRAANATMVREPA
jgi:methionine sulfoxide reductase heme-binding subunit